MLESQITTPALVLDMDLFEKNLSTLKNMCDRIGLAMRPHYKSSKCTYLAHEQIRTGAIGICCAKVSEAEDLVTSGIEDVLIANQVTSKSGVVKVAELASSCHMGVCVDDEDNIEQLERAAALFNSVIYCYIEYDVGMNRCGVDDLESFVRLATMINAKQHLVFAGIQAYAGNLAHCVDVEKRARESAKVEKRLKELVAYLDNRGIVVNVITGVSTGTIGLRKSGTVYTEVQCGSYIYMDSAYNEVGAPFAHSLTVLTTVMKAYHDHITMDAGLKSVSFDQREPFYAEFPESHVDWSEEHSTLAVNGPRSGDKLHIVPSHCCTTLNIYDWLYLTRKGKVVDRIPVTGRGKSC